LARSLIVAAAVASAAIRPVAVGKFRQLRATSDVYTLPPPVETGVASLGYRSAFADWLFVQTLVEYGLHFDEKRRFEFVGQYLDTITELDPTFRDPYRFADTLLVFSPEPARVEDYVKAREVLLRGIANRPSDAELFIQVGQYLSYLAPPNLPKDLAESFRRKGGEILARACELAGTSENLPYQCITAARVLENAGEREAAIEAMRRVLAVNDDPYIEHLALSYLGLKLSERDRDREEHRKSAFREVWKADLPFVSKDAMLVLGPKVDTAACAGLGRSDETECAPTWREWARHVDPRAQ
jgi:hypothetical protein